MCGRYVVITRVERVEKRFNVIAPTPELFAPDPNIGVGAMAPVILDREPGALVLARFGFSPPWARKKMYLFNARAEGDHNQANDPRYSGARGILDKPAFRKPIRTQRCLVVADAIIEGPTGEGLSKPWLIYLRQEERPFAMAGIWENWTDPATGLNATGFAIITVPANDLVRRVGHDRCPVILEKDEEQAWLSTQTPLHDITAMLRSPDPERMNAYPISPEIKKPTSHSIALLQPTGERLRPEYSFEISSRLQCYGMGESPSKEKRKKDNPDQLSLFE